MHADVYQSVGSKDSADPAVESDILMVRSVLFVKEQAHGIALNTKTRLHADKDIAKSDTSDKKLVRFDRGYLSGETAPASFNALAFPVAGDAVELFTVYGKALLFVRLYFVIGGLVEHGKQGFRRFR